MFVTTDKGFSEHWDERNCGSRRAADSRTDSVGVLSYDFLSHAARTRSRTPDYRGGVLKEGRFESALLMRTLRAASSDDRHQHGGLADSDDPFARPRQRLAAARSVRGQRAVSYRPSLFAASLFFLIHAA